MSYPYRRPSSTPIPRYLNPPRTILPPRAFLPWIATAISPRNGAISVGIGAEWRDALAFAVRDGEQSVGAAVGGCFALEGMGSSGEEEGAAREDGELAEKKGPHDD